MSRFRKDPDPRFWRINRSLEFDWPLATYDLDQSRAHARALQRIGVLEASRRLGVARGTVQARLDKLASQGVVTGWGPDLAPEALGYPVTAFLTLEIRQGAGHDAVGVHLAGIPEVLEACTITGAGDMWCRLVARSNTDLQRVIDRVLSSAGIVRSTTVIALAEQVPYRVLPLARRATSG